MFTIKGWRPGQQYSRIATTLADALGYLEEAEKQGFLSVKVQDETGRIYLVPEMRRTRGTNQDRGREEGSKRA